jgi:hypothetical protein
VLGAFLAFVVLHVAAADDEPQRFGLAEGQLRMPPLLRAFSVVNCTKSQVTKKCR